MGYILPGLLLVGGATYFYYRRPRSALVPASNSISTTSTTATTKTTSMMSAPAATLAAPVLTPMSPSTLSQYDGSDGRPIYVAIKGQIYDVSAKQEMYGKGAGYSVFAGKDASRGLGTSI